MQQDVQPSIMRQKDAVQRQPYEKPQLGKVTLVADQVLACYTVAPCNDNPFLQSSG